MGDNYFEELKDSDKKIIESLAGMWSRNNILTANEIREIMNNDYDFSCWVIKYDRVSINNKIYRKNSLKRDTYIHIVPLFWNHEHFDADSVLGHAVLEYRDEGVYAYCKLFELPINHELILKLIRDKGSVALSPFVINVKYHGDFIVNGIIKEVSLVPERIDPDECYYPVMKGEE